MATSRGDEITAGSKLLACGGGVAVEREETSSSNKASGIWTRSRRAREGAEACALVCEETAGWIRRRRRVIASVDLPEETVVWEILVRLPAKSLLRCRAVCRSWYTLTSAPNFLVAHHKHQPSLPLIQFSRMKDGYVVLGRPLLHIATLLNACDLRRRRRRPVFCLRFPRERYDRDPVLDISFDASCDGLLLFSSRDGCSYICNPATRECALLPELTGMCGVAGLYLHRSSGEYRVLYWKKNWPSDHNVRYYVLTVGSPEPRCIGLPMASPSMEKAMLAGMYCYSDAHCFWQVPVPMPVVLHNCLHWPDLRTAGQHLERLVVFDTVLESFRWMRSPATTADTRASLFEMEGMLGISCLDVSDRLVKIWLLQDYGRETSWSLKFQIQVPTVETDISSYIRVMSLDRETLICYSHGYSASCSALFHCDISKGELLKEFTWRTLQPTITGHWFKESLIRHAFFQRQEDVSHLCFFQGL